MRHAAPKTSKFSHKHALKSSFVLVGVALVLALLIGATGIANDQAAQKATRQAQIQKEADAQVEREKAAEAVKTKAEYNKCIDTANSQYGHDLANIPKELTDEARIQAIQSVGELIESFKRDCDRRYQQT